MYNGNVMLELGIVIQPFKEIRILLLAALLWLT